MQYLSEYLENIGIEGKHWIDYHIIIGKIKDYEKKYGIKIRIIRVNPKTTIKEIFLLVN